MTVACKRKFTLHHIDMLSQTYLKKKIIIELLFDQKRQIMNFRLPANGTHFVAETIVHKWGGV